MDDWTQTREADRMSDVRMKRGKTPTDGGEPWRWFADPEATRDYLAFATHLELRSALGLPRFAWYSLRIERQLARTQGLVGYSFRRQFPTRYWTMSAWESERHLLEFVRAMPHARVRRVLQPSRERFATARWHVSGSALPLAWTDALRQLDAKDSLLTQAT